MRLTATRTAGCCLVLAIALACSFELVAPFGDSRDGVNGGAWGLASRHVREDGLAASRWGALAEGRSPEVYVNHPPLIIATTAASESLVGEQPWSSRIPSLLATSAAGLLVLLVLRELGHATSTAAAATALAFGVPMVRTYGAMVDTPVLGLPFAVGLTLLWLRDRHGTTTSPLAWGLLGLGAGLSSWLGWPIAGAVLVALAAAWRWRTALALGAGLALAGGLLVLWVVQSGAGVQGLVDLAGTRSGARAAVSLVEGLEVNLTSAYPPWTLLLAVPGAVVALVRARSRPIVAVWWIAVVAWCLAFQERAATHEYWTWWALLPLAAGWAALVDAVLPRLSPTDVRRALPAVGIAFALLGVLLPSRGWTTFVQGQDAGRLLLAAEYQPGQTQAWVLTTSTDDILPWVSYQARLPMAPLHPADVAGLVAAAPNDLVLTSVTAGPPSATAASATCLPPTSVRGRYALVTASTLVQGLQPGCS